VGEGPLQRYPNHTPLQPKGFRRGFQTPPIALPARRLSALFDAIRGDRDQDTRGRRPKGHMKKIPRPFAIWASDRGCNDARDVMTAMAFALVRDVEAPKR